MTAAATVTVTVTGPATVPPSGYERACAGLLPELAARVGPPLAEGRWFALERTTGRYGRVELPLGGRTYRAHAFAEAFAAALGTPAGPPDGSFWCVLAGGPRTDRAVLRGLRGGLADAAAAHGFAVHWPQVHDQELLDMAAQLDGLDTGVLLVAELSDRAPA
ncbi:hypothetical protein OH807_20400 [Kitasatospora sp. NBC_01560]|uniref:hypothetical protein n=1 Tax=Kitasatospora sp. NBC_01560 TaxID=2975965 RepID=UPI003864ED40